MGSQTLTGSVILVPSGYVGLSNLTIETSYPATNAYTDTSDGNYAQFTLAASTTGYLYFTFDTSSIPSNATITSITGSVRARVSNTSRVTNTQCQLFSGTSAKGQNVTFASTSSSNIVTLSPGSASTWTRANLNDLRLKIGGTSSSSGSSKYIRVYGASVTIEYTYTITTYDITLTNNTSANVSLSDTSAAAGNSITITADTLNNITIKDNNVDITNSFVQFTGATATEVPSGNTNSNFTLTNIDNAYAGHDNSDYARLQLAGSTTGTFYLNFPAITLPSGASLQSVSCQATLEFNRNGSTSGFTSSFQMYSGSTAKGSSTSWVTSGSANVAKTTYTPTMGNWTTSDLSNPKFYITATNSARSTVRYIYVYGATLSVTYELSGGGVYTYTISNIQSNHTIVVSSSAPTETLYFKNNGNWVAATEVYKKVSGSWVLQTTLSSVFDAITNYVKG